ncbi:MAG: NAD-dependent epimerase/dehydratase family protein, partial [Chloroflexota bacterium]
MTARRVLVTGGAGFVGSNVVDALLVRGDEVVVVDDLSTGDRANLRDGVDLRVVDISDGPALGRVLEGEHFDAVVHLASRTKVVQSMEEPELYRRVIIDGTRNVIDAALATGARDLVNISTGGAIYGETPECANEEAPLRAASPYGRFKAESEPILHGSGLRAATLRLANVYGPRQRQDLEGGVIAIFIGCWKRGHPLTVYGDGTAQRDYVYVGDVAEAVLATLDATVTGPYNIGTGVATSVNDLHRRLGRIAGAARAPRHGPGRPGEQRRSVLDATRAKTRLGWTAATPLD